MPHLVSTKKDRIVGSIFILERAIEAVEANHWVDFKILYRVEETDVIDTIVPLHLEGDFKLARFILDAYKRQTEDV